MMELLRDGHRWSIWICIILLTGSLSCLKSGADTDGELYIKLVDAPAAYQAIKFHFTSVSILRAGSSVGWHYVDVNDEGKNVDILQLRNGNDRTLVLSKVPAGKYNQIKLQFGFCSVIVNGFEYKLVDSTEAVVYYPFEIVEGRQFQLTFDFEIDKSILPAGNHYSLIPQFRIQQTDLSGSIAGSVFRVDSVPHPVAANIYAYSSTLLDTITTTNDTTGSFQLSDLPEQKTYDITIVPFDTVTFRDTIIQVPNLLRTDQPRSLGVIYLSNR